MIPDGELVRRSLSQGSHHFGLLIQRHTAYVFALAMRMSQGQHAVAEDLVQQSFLNAFSRLKSFDRKRDFRGWLTAICVNCYRDMLRRDSATEQVELPDIAAVTNEDDDRAFVDLIAPLQPETRILFILRYVYEYKVAEIAELMDMKPGSIKSTLSRATAQLRSIHSDTNPDVQSPQCANLGRQE